MAIVRPGPIQGGMVHPYLRRRTKEEPVTYPNEEIKKVLEKTLGIPIFQEQAMQLAVVAAGFTPGDADQLRRAMAAWRRPGLIDQFRRKLMNGMAAKGLPEEFAERVYKQIQGFGSYGFPESHAASFALLVYASAWLKHHYPAAFAAAIINSQPMGFYAPAQLIRDALDHGVVVLPVDVNHSCWDCTLEKGTRSGDRGASNNLSRSSFLDPCPSLRLGFRMIDGLAESVAKTIKQIRESGLFLSVDDFTHRTGCGQAVVKRLAEADAFCSVGTNRRQALWQSLAQEKKSRSLLLFTGCEEPEPLPAALPAMVLHEEVVADYCSAGLSLRAHPISFYREQLNRLDIVPAKELAELANGASVRVAALVILRQRPGTAKGITFVTLEDETGSINLVVHQRTWDSYHRIARRSPAWIAHGHLQTTRGNPEHPPGSASSEQETPVIHVVVRRLEALAEQLGALEIKSRDFR